MTPDLGGIQRRKRKRRGSDGTQTGSDGTRSAEDATASEGEFDLAAKFMEPSEGWWTSFGFKSLGEYLRYSETGPDRQASLTARPRREKIPAPEPPGGAVPRPRHGPRAKSRQISIRLDEDGYQALVKAASMYGVAPATMGRLLVAKGAQKVVQTG